MTDSNPVFVKIFRDEEAWKRREGAFEIAKGKFDAEQAYREDKAVRGGISELSLSLMYNPGPTVDPNGIFPEISDDEWDQIYLISREGCYSTSFSWPALTEYSDATGCRYRKYVPTKILDETALVRLQTFFYYTTLYSNATHANAILVGFRDKKHYLIAYWGSKKVYDQMQEKLRELREPKAQPVQEKPKEIPAQSNDNFPSGILKGFTYTLFTGLIVAALCQIYALYERSGYESNPPKSVVAQTAATEECIDCGTWRKPCDSVYDLQVGKVLEKRVGLVNCPNGKEHCYILYFKEEHTASYQLVTKDVFDKVKLGDEIPFQRPQY